MLKRRWCTLAAVVCMAAAAMAARPAWAGQVGFEEDFALAPDRTVPLKQLIPGTPDYYFFNCLHLQNTGQFDKADEMLQAWIKRHGQDARTQEIQNRQALLRYPKEPRKALDYLAWRLNLTFNHERETLDRQRQLPTALDQSLISRETLAKRALAHDPDRLSGFEATALDWLVPMELSDARLHELLSRLTRPDYKDLTKLVAHDLTTPFNSGFGTLNIHKQLLLTQLDELLKLRPELRNESNFVMAYLVRLRPANGVDWRHDPREQAAYFDRVWEFVKQLGPVHNSLKAHVLYHRLAFDRTQNVWDKDRFMAYLQLPRNVSYINPRYMEVDERRMHPADLNADFASATCYPPIRSDDAVVRSYLMHFFVEAEDYDAYKPLVHEDFLRETFAETKIVNGIGEQEKWYALLPADKHQALKERVDLDFAFANKQVFGPEEPVSLDLFVKNVKTLIVKVYEINAAGYYRREQREVGTDINLDGLVANEETVLTYDEPALRRVARHFEFPKLNRRGVFVVEFIGNGISSRALIFKGKLHHIARMGSAGQVITVLDEANKKVPTATVWLAGHEFKPDAEGQITVPFSTVPDCVPIVLQDGEMASLDMLAHQSENYSLAAGIHVEREALIRGAEATVVIRPTLAINGEPASLELLEEPTLVITSVDGDGTPTTKEVPNFKLSLDKEATYTFRVPDRLSKISFTLRGKVKNLSQNKKVDLADSRMFAVNGIDQSEKIEDLFFGRADGNYHLDVLGKTGEPLPDRPVNLIIKHRDFTEPVQVTLRSDAKGRVALGAMEGIIRVTATGSEGVQHSWQPAEDRHSLTPVLHGVAGRPLLVPYMGTRQAPAREELSLLELRDGCFTIDRFTALSIKGGFVVVQDLPPGDYSLRVKPAGEEVTIRLTAGESREGWVFSPSRLLEQRDPAPLQVAGMQADRENIRIVVANASELTRVHVAATRYVPEFPIFGSLLKAPVPGPSWRTLGPLEAQYVAGRNIGDEYRYIIDRKYTTKYPGNMLARPGLLLNPWAIRKTETDKQQAQPGQPMPALTPEGSQGGGGGGGHFGAAAGNGIHGSMQSNYDFLAAPAVVLTNLQPDEQGVVTIPRAKLGGHQELHVVAVDPRNTVYRELSLPETPAAPRDLRLAKGLDPEKHYTEQKLISAVKPGQDFTVADASNATVEVYDSLGKVYKLYMSLTHDPKLAEFSFLLDWPKLAKAEKQEKYSRYACHELNAFLWKKDPDFFKEVVQPYLKNKKDKTFMDHFLLGDDLAGYARPWAYGQLNIAERALLAQRLAGEQEKTARHIKDRYDLLPPDVERFNYLFRTAINGSALEQMADLRAHGFGWTERAAEGRTALLPATSPADGFTVNGGVLRDGSAAAPQSGIVANSLDEPARLEKLVKDQRELADELQKAGEETVGKEAGRMRAKKLRESMSEDREKRDKYQMLYRKLDKTEEWVENNYYHLPIEQQNAALVPVNAFWKDYAAQGGKPEFLSTNLAEAGRNFSEMMLALAVLDLPFEAVKHENSEKDGGVTLKPGGPMVVYHKEIREAAVDPAKTPILVSQNYFRLSDRYTYVDNEKADKYVSEEFLTHVVYGCQVVVTNPTSSRQKLDVLLQVPKGALPVSNGQYTKGVHLELAPYQTQALEYQFYFPLAGQFGHYPVHVARNEKLLAFCPAQTLKVVDTPSKVDKASWDYISQNATDEDVLTYLKDNNADRLNLERIAWRMKDAEFFRRVIELLGARHIYNHTLWSYGIKHDEVAAAREFLQHVDSFVASCGAYIDSPLLTIDPVIRKSYQHMEYSPLVNARTHKLGARRQIVNDRFFEQYERLLNVLRYRPTLDQDDLMAVTYYLLLQDRVEEGLASFAKVDARKLDTALQYDYFQAYLDFCREQPAKAREIAEKYKQYPVDRWRNLFAGVLAQLDEIEGKGAQVADQEDRNQQQAKLAATAENLELKVEARKVTLAYQNIKECRVNYYLMDIELMFSQNPFLGEFGGQFSSIKPNATAVVALDPAKGATTFDLPEKFQNSNVMIEVAAGGVVRTKAYYANALAVQLVENYGQLKVTGEKTGQPLAKVYVKVYARLKDGRIDFYKDGYTDLRGKFDYTSLNTNELDNVERFSILVLSETDGAVVREAGVPKQ